VACAVILATGTVENCISFLDMEPQGIRPYPPTHPQSFDFMSATMLINCICIKDMTVWIIKGRKEQKKSS
jgi:hypothetical protein